jgi:hypothetical protein
MRIRHVVLMVLAFAWVMGCAKEEVQPTGKGTVTGKITLSGQTDHSGISVEIIGTGLRAETKADGSFTIKDVPKGTYMVEISKEGYSREVKEITVEEGKTVSLTLTLESKVRLTGRALLPGNKAQPGIMVVVEGTEFQAKTDAKGEYVIEGKIPPGDIVVVASMEGYFEAKATVKVEPGKAEISVPDLVLREKPLFYEDFSSPDAIKNWAYWGEDVANLPKIEVVGGFLVITSNQEKKPFGVRLEKGPFNITETVTFEEVFIHADPSSGTEWNVYLTTEKSEPTGDFSTDMWDVNCLNISIHDGKMWINARHGSVSIDDKPIDAVKPDKNPHKISITLDANNYIVYWDGKEVDRGSHGLTKPEVYFSTSTYNSPPGMAHKVDEVVIYKGGYTDNPPKK